MNLCVLPRGAIGSDIVFTIFASSPNLQIRILRDMKNAISIRQNRISDTDQILADWIWILTGYVKTDTIKDKLNRYTYIIFLSSKII